MSSKQINILKISDWISLSRVIVLPLWVWLFSFGDRFFLWTILVFSWMVVSDALDGWVSRRFVGETKFGQLLDPICDKIVIFGVGMTLSWFGLCPWQLFVFFTFRDIVFVLIGCWLRRRCLPIPKANVLGKLATCFFATGALLSIFGGDENANFFLGVFTHYIWIVTGGMALISMLSYGKIVVRLFRIR